MKRSKCTSYAKEKLKCHNFIILNSVLILICHIFITIVIIFNSLYFDMTIKPSLKVQNIALINVNYNEKEVIK